MTLAPGLGSGVRRIEQIWGTVVSVDVRDLSDRRPVDDVFDWFARVDELFSTWRDDSEICRVGRGELRLADASPEVREVLEHCEELHAETGGAFDVTVGARAGVSPRPGLAPIDPSGYVKGWAVERAAARLEAAGATRFCINAGGDIVVRSEQGADDRAAADWRIGIQHPWERDKVALVVRIANGAVAASGTTERGDHVLDPRTGRPAAGLVTAVVIGADLGRADALATAALAHGSIDVEWLVGTAAMAITDGGTVVTTPEFDPFRAG